MGWQKGTMIETPWTNAVREVGSRPRCQECMGIVTVKLVMIWGDRGKQAFSLGLGGTDRAGHALP